MTLGTRRGAALFGFVVLASSASAASGRAVELDVQDVVSRLEQWLDGTRDLEARFEQSVISGALGEGPVERGRLSLLRPGHMRWDYLEPERKVALVEGDETRLYLEEDRQLWLGRLTEQGGLLPILLGGGPPLGELFEASLLATPRHGGDGTYRLRLVPRSAEPSFHEVLLTLRPPQFGVELAEVLDAGGNRVRYRFGEWKRNRGLAPAVFYCEPPPGTEVVTP